MPGSHSSGMKVVEGKKVVALGSSTTPRMSFGCGRRKSRSSSRCLRLGCPNRRRWRLKCPNVHGLGMRLKQSGGKMILETWLDETTPSAIPSQVKEWCCYLTIAQVLQARGQTLYYANTSGATFHLEHVKTISLSCILTGDPGSYKSEAVRLMKKVCMAYNDLALAMENLHLTKPCVNVYPHDKVTSEWLLTTLYKWSKEREGSEESTCTSIFVDELVTFLNRKEYVAHLIGDLNCLMDQPPSYGVGTQKRQDEIILNPVASLLAACAPSWFKFLPEPLFTGGFTGRCMFYGVPYPKDEDRQPRGSAVRKGGALRIAKALFNMPDTPLVMTPEAIALYDTWERAWGKRRVHPLQALDEWFKRRAILSARLAGCVALAQYETSVTVHHMQRANFHMEHVLNTLEAVWEEIDSDDSIRFRVLQTALVGKALNDVELLDLAVDKMRSSGKAMQILDYMKRVGIIVPKEGKWQFPTVG